MGEWTRRSLLVWGTIHPGPFSQRHFFFCATQLEFYLARCPELRKHWEMRSRCWQNCIPAANGMKAVPCCHWSTVLQQQGQQSMVHGPPPPCKTKNWGMVVRPPSKGGEAANQMRNAQQPTEDSSSSCFPYWRCPSCCCSPALFLNENSFPP